MIPTKPVGAHDRSEPSVLGVQPVEGLARVTVSGRTNRSVLITWCTWVNRSACSQSPSVTTPIGIPSLGHDRRAPWLRLGMTASAIPVVSVGVSVTAVSNTVCGP